MTCMKTVIDGMSPMSSISDGWGNFTSNATDFFQKFGVFFSFDYCFIITSSPQVACFLKLLTTAYISPPILQNSLSNPFNLNLISCNLFLCTQQLPISLCTAASFSFDLCVPCRVEGF